MAITKPAPPAADERAGPSRGSEGPRLDSPLALTLLLILQIGRAHV